MQTGEETILKTDKAVADYLDANADDIEWNEYIMEGRESIVGAQTIVNSAEMLVGLRLITKVF